MGFLDWIGGIADKVTGALGIPWKPSGLISKAGELLPAVADAVPGIGPVLSEGLSVAQSIFGGKKKERPSPTSTPVGDVVKDEEVVKPELSKMSETISSIESEIGKNRKEFDEAVKKEEDILNKIDGKISLEARLEERRGILDRIKTRHVQLVDSVQPAITFLKNNLEKLHDIKAPRRDITYIIGLIGDSSRPESPGELTVYCNKLQDAIVNIRGSLDDKHVMQENLDLYVFSVTWLLTYRKAIVTLRSIVAQYYSAGSQFAEYVKTIESWHLDIGNLVQDAKSNADYILGPEDGPKGRIEVLAEARLQCITNPQLSKCTGRFYDSYPQIGLGFKLTSIASPEDTGLVTIEKTGENEGDAEKRTNDLRSDYLYIQGASFTSATSEVVKMAAAWRYSAKQWQNHLPFNPKDASFEVSDSGDPPSSFAQTGNGYKANEHVTHGVSFVTMFGEGKVHWGDTKTIQRDKPFIKIELKKVKDVPDPAPEGHFPAASPAIVRRVYSKVVGADQKEMIYHIEDKSGLVSQEFTVLDQAKNRYPHEN